ncbi:MAG: hypothetical protein II748_03235 [Clostridia bacterium]|nr:hypothetical protein [Clostridia bacterium]
MWGVLLFLFYIGLGIFTAFFLFREQRALLKVWIGSVFGTMLLMWSNVPFSFIFGFTRLSHVCGMGMTLLIVAGAFVWRKVYEKKHPYEIEEPKFTEEKITENTETTPSEGSPTPNKTNSKKFNIFRYITADELVMIIFVCVFMLFPIFTLPSHTLTEVDGAYYTGQCTYGDMNMHLGFITSIAEQGMFPPEYSILPGAALNYPFLCDTVSSSVYLFGASLRVAYMLPMFFAFAQVFLGFWFLASSVLKKTSKTAVAFTLFFLNGGFGLIYFLDHVTKEDKSNFTRIFTAFYNTPTNLVNSGKSYSNIRWTNAMVDMMLPQRATLFGWMALFAALWLLYNAVFEKKGLKYYLLAGIVAGLMPMIHTHSYFATGLIAICWIIYSCVRDRFGKQTVFGWLSFGIPALALSLLQIIKWTFNAVGESFVRYHYDWCNTTDNPIWFWVKNIGLVLLILPAAFISVDKKKKAMYTGAMLIFLIAEFFVFQPNDYDNNKLFLVWYIFTAIIVADFMIECYRKLKGLKGRVAIAIVVMLICTNAAGFTIAREVVSGYRPYSYQLYSADMVDACDWIKDNTEPDSLFLCNNNHNNAVSSLSGRNIFCGAGTFLYFHGVGYSEREAELKKIFANVSKFDEAVSEYGIDYVYISSYERANLDKTLIQYLEDNYEPAYSKGEVKIYDVRA